MGNRYDLYNRIENLRDKLHCLILETNNLTSHEVIELSQELDKLLNEYNEIYK